MTTLTYNKKQFISPDTHSSGYIFCYYNTDCLNSEFKWFIRIADCQESHLINFTGRSKAYIRGFFKKMLALLDGRIKDFYDTEFHYQLKLNKNPFRYRLHIQSTVNKTEYGFYKTVLYIHADEDTCDRQEWSNKISIIKTQLQDFKLFLEENKLL